MLELWFMLSLSLWFCRLFYSAGCLMMCLKMLNCTAWHDFKFKMQKFLSFTAIPDAFTSCLQLNGAASCFGRSKQQVLLKLEWLGQNMVDLPLMWQQ